jgi:flagellar hook-length control protein FliK
MPLKASAEPSVNTAASGGVPHGKQGTTDPLATAASSGSALANVTQQPSAAKQEAGAGVADTAKADAAGGASSTAVPAPPAHDHSAVDAKADSPATSPDAGVQSNATVQPPLPAAAAAAPAALLPLTVTAAINAPVPLSGLALEIAASARSGKSRFEIRLDPADLGRIDVRIDVDRNGQVTSHLTVERPETLSMLRQDAPQLQRALDDAGFKTGNGGLRFSLRDQSSSGQNSGNETGRNAHRLVVSEEDPIPAAIAGRTYGRMLGSSSGVDISV